MSERKVTSRAAMPTRVGPAHTPRKHRRGGTFGRIVKILAVLIIIAALALGGLFAYEKFRPSPDATAEKAIEKYLDAVRSGDLNKLRDITCGAAHDYYANLTTDEFAQIYAASNDSVPILDSVDRVEITGNRAIAAVTAHTNAHADKTNRTVGLERAGDSWKVCDGPAAASGVN